MFRSDDDKASRAAQKEAERRQREQEKADKEFADSPQGRARAAYQRGDGFFEIELDLRDTGSLNSYGGSGSDRNEWTGGPHRPKTARLDTLSVIESEGWILAHMNHVFVQTGEDSRDKWTGSGQRVAIKGKIIGVYLFRRAEPQAPMAAPASPSHGQAGPPPQPGWQ